MSGWNPVEGLESVGYNDIRKGDVLRSVTTNGGVVTAVEGVVAEKSKVGGVEFYSATSGVFIRRGVIEDDIKLFRVKKAAPMDEPQEIRSKVKFDYMQGYEHYVLVAVNAGDSNWLILDVDENEFFTPFEIETHREWNESVVQWPDIARYSPQPYEWGDEL